MRKHLLAASAAIIFSTPAAARDGAGYIGIEGGILFPRSQSGAFTATFTQSAQSPAPGSTAVATGTTGRVGTLPAAFTTLPAAVTGGSRVHYKRGYDVDLIGGYDFGMFRIEGEIGYKRSAFKSFSVDPALITGIEAGLNPVGATGTTFTFPATNAAQFDLANHVGVLSGMVNGLLDFGIGGATVSAGAGFGRARVEAFGGHDQAWAWQGIAGVRFPITPNIDLGVKYRYFRTGHLNFSPSPAAVTSTSRTVAVPNVPATTGGTATGSTNVTFTRTAALTGAFDDHFASHSLLLSLIYNFGAVAAAPPPPPPPPPSPPPPATQTCPDGSVIPATATCPVPPPPPPPPPPPAQRGERG